MSKDYLPHIFLEECKNVVKEKKTTKFINDELEHFPNKSDEGISDEK